jgi:hypothetical protein
MPEMVLFGPELLLSRVPGVWVSLFSYMFWPGDEQQRNAFCARPYVTALSSVERKRAAGLDYAGDYLVLHQIFLRIAGWSTFGVAPLEPLAATGRKLRTAAAVLDIIRRTPQEGSLNKALYVIGTVADKYRLIRNRTDIRKAWESHRSVAHLGVALKCSGDFTTGDFLKDPARLRRFLAIARDYQSFATSYVMPRQNRPLVDRAEIWFIRPSLRLPRLRSPPPLPRDMLMALAEYRAPRYD